jgi:Astacin (Peptidase family M12A)
MRKSFVIGATIFVMGFVACTQPSRLAVPSTEIGRNVQSNATQPTTDTYVADIETNSKDENLDDATTKKLKTRLKKIQHTFSNGEKLRYIIAEHGQVITGTNHGITIAQDEDLPKFIKDREVEIKKLKPKGVVRSNNLWPNNVIPFTIDSAFSVKQREAIDQAITWWNNSSIIVKFQPHSGQWSGVQFVATSLSKCSASVGNTGSIWSVAAQTITLGSTCSSETALESHKYYIYDILHEMGHTAGLYHEQQRCDRDSFVYVTYPWWDWVSATNYGKECSVGVLGIGLYDCSSNMHYYYGSNGGTSVWMYPFGNNMTSGPAARVWSGNWTNPRTSFPSTSTRNSMSRGDIVAINSVYQVSFNLATYGNWNARYHNWHDTGRVDGDGWSASVVLDSPAYMVFGPYLLVSSMGSYATCCSVFFELMTDNINSNTQSVARLDVLRREQSASGILTYSVLATRTLVRSDFSAVNQYKIFELNFENQELFTGSGPNPSDKLEFGVYFLDASNVKVRNVTLRQ